MSREANAPHRGRGFLGASRGLPMAPGSPGTSPCGAREEDPLVGSRFTADLAAGRVAVLGPVETIRSTRPTTAKRTPTTRTNATNSIPSGSLSPALATNAAPLARTPSASRAAPPTRYPLRRPSRPPSHATHALEGLCSFVPLFRKTAGTEPWRGPQVDLALGRREGINTYKCSIGVSGIGHGSRERGLADARGSFRDGVRCRDRPLRIRPPSRGIPPESAP